MSRTSTKGGGFYAKGTLVAGALVAISLLAAACGAGPRPSGVASLGKTKVSSPVAGGVATTLPSGARAEPQLARLPGCDDKVQRLEGTSGVESDGFAGHFVPAPAVGCTTLVVAGRLLGHPEVAIWSAQPGINRVVTEKSPRIDRAFKVAG